jgi:hypothetical protein
VGFLDIETGYLETWKHSKVAASHYTTGRSAELHVIALSRLIDILQDAHGRASQVSLPEPCSTAIGMNAA